MAPTTTMSVLKAELTRLPSWDQAKVELARLQEAGVLDREACRQLVRSVATYFLFAAEDLRAR